MNIFKIIGDSTALTTAMLGITGGIIAVFGLIKSHQKSELEREQLDTQKKKIHKNMLDRFMLLDAVAILKRLISLQATMPQHVLEVYTLLLGL